MKKIAAIMLMASATACAGLDTKTIHGGKPLPEDMQGMVVTNIQSQLVIITLEQKLVDPTASKPPPDDPPGAAPPPGGKPPGKSSRRRPVGEPPTLVCARTIELRTMPILTGDRLLVGPNTSPLFDTKFKLSLREDGTISEISSDATPKLEEAAKALSSFATTLTSFLAPPAKPGPGPSTPGRPPCELLTMPIAVLPAHKFWSQVEDGTLLATLQAHTAPR